jgi:hypothetical protein
MGAAVQGWVSAMRCMACGAEMRLMQSVPDDTMMVTGYEHQTWACTGCDEVERRLMFTRAKTPIDAVPAPAVAPQDAPAVRGEPEPEPGPITAAIPSAWSRAVAMFRGKPTD